MAIDQESFNKKLYDLLKTRGYRPIPKDSKNERTMGPQDADVFNFTFVKAGQELGDVWVTIDDAQDVILYYDDDIMDTGDRSKGSEYDDSWTAFIQHLKRWAMSKQLGFELRDKNKLGDDMTQREYAKKKENLSEGYYAIGKQSSYSDAVPTVKIILQHTRQIQEGEQRYRNIARIFLENQVGERILAPTIRPGVAQVYARHLAEGGLPNDDRWNHIKNLCEEYTKMAGFVRAAKNNQFNESAQKLINEGINHYHNLRETLGRMRGHRGYHKYFESYTPALMETEGDESNLSGLFVQETLDPRIESVIPILSRLQKNVTEMREVNELAEWADSLLEGGDGSEASEEEDGDTSGDAGEGGGEDASEDDLMEAPGAETLAHNQNTEKGNLKAFDLEEDSEDKKLSRKLKANIDHINSKLKDSNVSDADKKDLRFKLKIYSDRLGKKKDSKEPDSHYSSDTKQGQIAQAAHERVRKVEKKTAGDLVHDVTGLEEDNEPYEDMSDIELIRLCRQMGLEKSCVRDGEGKLANRDEVVSLLKSQDDDLSSEGVAEGSLEEGKLENIIIAFAIAGGSLIGGAAGYESHQNQQRWKAAYVQIKDQDPATAEQIRALTIKYKTAPLKFGPDVLTSKKIDKIISDFENQKLKEQGMAEAAKWRRDDLKGKTWRSADWDDGDLSPGKIQIDRHGKDVDDSGDELKARPGMWGGKYKRMTKKGTPTQHELGMQNNLKMRIKMQNKQGGLSSPKGPLPEEQGMAEGSLPSYLRGESRFVKSAYKTLIKYGFIPDDEDERTAQMGSFNHVKGHMAEITWEGNIKLWIKQPNGKYTRLYLDDATEMPKVAVQLKLAPVGTEQGVAEGYTVTRGIDKERYQFRPGLEGPFSAKNGKVVYYDKVEGKYYDPDTDMYIDHEDWQAMNEGQMSEGSGIAKYKVKSIGVDSRGKYYISPSTGKKVYKSGVKVGDHENSRTGVITPSIKEQDVAENLDANQKRVGQLGPTEKVKNNNIGKLVGASESTKSKEKAITEMDSEGYKGHREDGDPYAKGAKAKPSKPKDTAKDAEKALNKSMDKAHKKDVKEGQEDLDAILRLLGK